MNPFFDNYFVSGDAQALYERSLGMFKGGKWRNDTPLPTTGTGTSLSQWWNATCAPLWALARPDPALTAAKLDVNKKLLELVGDPPSGSSKADLGNAAVTALANLEKLLREQLSALASGSWEASEAVAGFKNASLSAVNAAVVAVEAAERKDDILGPSLNETFDEVFLRNASASLWDVGKDPPDGLFFHKEDVPTAYLSLVGSLIGSPGSDQAVTAMKTQLGTNCGDFQEFDGYLTSGKDKNGPLGDATKREYQGKRSTAMRAMAGTIQQLRETTRQFVSKGKPAQPAVEMSVVAAETMRCVLKMTARGGPGNFEWRDRDYDNTVVAELHTLSKERVGEIKKEIDKERQEDPNRQLV